MGENNDKQKFMMECPECDSGDIETEMITHKFEYNTGKEMKVLECEMPARQCRNCGAEYIDNEAEEKMHEAICKFWELMTPLQIKGLRKLYNFTQSEFCEITRIGEATLSRWERGTILQSAANDNYLYLLGFQKNLERLQNKYKEISSGVVERREAKFRLIKPDNEMLEKVKQFELCAMMGRESLTCTL